MTRTMTGLCIAAAFSMVGVGAAQERTSTTTSEQRASTTTSKDADHDVTATGCLSRGADGRFMLNNVARNGETNSSASTTTGTSGSVGAATARSWTLEGKDSELAEHVGHRIEVKGRLMPAAVTSTTTAPGAASSTTAQEKFDVESVRMVAASCGS